MDLCLAFSFTAPILFLGAGGGEITLKCSSSSNSNAIRSLVPSKHGRCLIMMLPCGWFCGFFRVWPFHLWRSCLYFHCSSSLSNSLTWDSLLCQISLLSRLPSKNEARLILLIHVLFNHSWKEEKLFVRCNIDPATLQVIFFPNPGSGNSLSCPSITRTHSTCSIFFSVEAHSL